MAIIGYARVSTRGQRLEAQIKALLAAGVEEDFLYQEKESGVKADRPQLAEMLRTARKGDTVITTKLDRLARSTKHLLEIAEQLKAKGAALKILNMDLDTGTANGKLMLTILAGIAEFERELMLERQAEGFAIAKAKGRIKGRPCTAQNKTDEIVRRAAAGETKAQIAKDLNLGVSSVYRILAEAKRE